MAGNSKSDNAKCIKTYLEENKHLQKINSDQEIDVNITENDEIWLVQCPSDIDLKQLQNQKLKFPGKTSIDNVEVISEELMKSKHVTVALKPKKVENLRIKGNIVIRNKLQPTKFDEIDIRHEHKTVPFPSDLKERHPLLGYDYNEKLNLTKSILKRLKRCRDRKQDKKSRIKLETVKVEDDDNVVNLTVREAPVKIKKEKKRKRKRSAEDLVEIKSEPLSQNDNNRDLNWIKKL